MTPRRKRQQDAIGHARELAARSSLSEQAGNPCTECGGCGRCYDCLGDGQIGPRRYHVQDESCGSCEGYGLCSLCEGSGTMI